jgi:hypothetical protein
METGPFSETRHSIQNNIQRAKSRDPTMLRENIMFHVHGMRMVATEKFKI